ncbi:MAG: hypothetical protein A3G49_02935 [Candidatus Sungbacteria bacterium RIFCSPLOWO2_12_FULL_41_11]|uniref:Uncharacterized protein n=1 Tax=Candidatus Sungbacteria bacterium RIFCSPLOWO2_12_FULL_41_11 TaxID=1802286 RepID=A0A1G2LRA6_9BACT|nr:MAG: hypothetical protein UV01_C0001G0094 [Parcubacteria group bacterium GW2011_GWA2_42_14]OGZ98839.1 MAG: hypothetical protein A3D41_02260 [Candidatus Sungbacteria bacterium RIFCSPHIGHO2_02_FULL_41_12b]OHA14170.1 MAG: hypothetical protein A3G49_02935 [Candidatus Sungbacteria bacterium RIFCSPLOWO2_12_FULL_41_11]
MRKFNAILVISCILFLILAVGLIPINSASANEPGPDFKNWTKSREWVEQNDVDIVKRTFQGPSNHDNEVFTLSLRTEKNETLFKEWDYKQKGSIKSALRLPSGEWFVGDTGKRVDIHMELGLFGYNLFIHVFKLENKWFAKCKKENEEMKKKQAWPWSKVESEDCNKFLDDKKYNGMYISIPVRKYDWKE